MLHREDKDVTRVARPAGHERKDRVVAKHDRRRPRARDDLAEDARRGFVGARRQAGQCKQDDKDEAG